MWIDLVRDNPVIKESQRSFWERIHPKTWPTNTTITIAIVAIVYFVLITLALQGISFIDPSVFMFVSLTVTIFVSAVVLYGTLAGEREKRTLDLLLVAPVTASQIVAAKTLKVVIPILAIIVLLDIPALVFAIVRNANGMKTMSSGASFPIAFFGSTVLILSVALFVIGLTMLVSSINRTTAGALTGTIAVLFLAYIVFPVITGVLAVFSRPLSDTMSSVHPFIALFHLVAPNPGWSNNILIATMCSIIHIVLGCTFIVLASRNVDRERKRGIAPNA